MIEDRPRIAAAKILALPKEQHASALANIAGERYRDAVKFYVEDHLKRVDQLARYVLGGGTLEERRHRLSHIDIRVREEVKTLVAERFRPRRGDAHVGT